jgi:hypothetical protein
MTLPILLTRTSKIVRTNHPDSPAYARVKTNLYLKKEVFLLLYTRTQAGLSGLVCVPRTGQTRYAMTFTTSLQMDGGQADDAVWGVPYAVGGGSRRGPVLWWAGLVAQLAQARDVFHMRHSLGLTVRVKRPSKTDHPARAEGPGHGHFRIAGRAMGRR